MLFQTRISIIFGIDQYSAAENGQKFLVIEPIEAANTRPITVVLDWTAALAIQR